MQVFPLIWRGVVHLGCGGVGRSVCSHGEVEPGSTFGERQPDIMLRWPIILLKILAWNVRAVHGLNYDTQLITVVSWLVLFCPPSLYIHLCIAWSLCHKIVIPKHFLWFVSICFERGKKERQRWLSDSDKKWERGSTGSKKAGESE